MGAPSLGGWGQERKCGSSEQKAFLRESLETLGNGTMLGSVRKTGAREGRGEKEKDC
jgi:hypothetical protein